MFRNTSSEVNIKGDNQIVKLLQNFKTENDSYSIQDFITFLQFVPFIEVEAQRKMTVQKLADMQTSHNIFIDYLRTKLTQASPKTSGTFTADELQRILNDKQIDLKLVEDLCNNSKSQSSMIKTVTAIIRSYSSKNGDENQVNEYLKESIKKTGGI